MKLRLITTGLFALSLLISLLASAQELSGTTRMEATTCIYNEGKGPKDLHEVNTKWNKWADHNKIPAYDLWNLTPRYVEDNTYIDVVRLGGWQNGIDMGKGLDIWKSKGSEIAAEYSKVLNCYENNSVESISIRSPDMTSQPKTAVVTFSNCNLNEGISVPDGILALEHWGKYLDSIGSKASIQALLPVYGRAAAEDWDFKLGVTHPNYTSLGYDWENSRNRRGGIKAIEIMAGSMTCDVPRVYDTTLIRRGIVEAD